ncbi:MAG: phosphate ABC transporter permease PstA [Planctomycetes bacterium]|nr:phosphate ABC transporter permease PstA [Planctomycetota bacterium]
MLWLTGGALATALVMIVGLLALVVHQGTSTFWPAAAWRIATVDGRILLGEVAVRETYRPEAMAFERLPEAQRAQAQAAVETQDGESVREMLRTGNFDVSGTHFTWVSDFEVAARARPEWAIVVERLAWGRFYGEPSEFRIGAESVGRGAAEAWARFQDHHAACRQRQARVRELETHAIGAVNAELEAARLALRRIELREGRTSPAYAAAEAAGRREEAALRARFTQIEGEIRALNQENDRFLIVFGTADGQTVEMKVAEIVRAYPANQLSWAERAGVYFSRWAEFLAAEPREANSEGGVFPAIFGTVVMTLLMSLLVVPFGVLAALYLREYAKQGLLVSGVRIAVNNLAGVPSIVFGVFGLGFFCYIVGATIDDLFHAERLPNPTYGRGGLMWASFTLALLTLPVVIVATEEALAAVPGSMREGSYACGATKWQTIRRIVLPRAMPGVMTGMILAIARGAGEVAPLMLVGAVKLAPELPVELSSAFPFLSVHPERSFMHLGFHIYDLGFQSQNSEAAKPMVYTTTLLLIALIVVLNVAAIWVRGRLRRKFQVGHF